jgi:hypothetical protein
VSARSRLRLCSPKAHWSKRRSSFGAVGVTAGTIRAGAARAGTSVALLGGEDSAGAAPQDGVVGATRALSTVRVLPFTTGRLFTGRLSTARVDLFTTNGRRDITPAKIGPATSV